MPYTIPLPQTLPNWHLKEGTTNGKLTGGDSIKKVSATVSSWQTCSKHCPMFNKCYAKKGFHTRQHANQTTLGKRGTDFDGFLQSIEDLRNNSFLRLSVSGDLPSEDWCYSTDERKIDVSKLQAIKKAVQSTNTTAFTYTHLHCDPKHRQHNLNAVKEVANKDLVINISVENKVTANWMKAQGFDVALVDSKTFEKAKEGKAEGFFACPAQYKNAEGEKSRCIACKMCSKFNRDQIVTFKED